MKYLIIDTTSKSYETGINWLGRLCIKYLMKTGVIMADQNGLNILKYLFMSGGYSAIRNISNPNDGFDEFKKRELEC